MTRLTFLFVLFLSSLLVFAETSSFWTRIAPFQALFQTILPSKPAFPPVKHAGIILPSEVFYELGGVSYMTPTHLPITTLTVQQRWEARNVFSVLTAIPLPEKGKQVTDRQISSIVDEFVATDDVFALPWLETVLFTSTPTNTPSKLSQRAIDALISRGTRTLLVPPSVSLSIHNDTNSRLEIIRLAAPLPSGQHLRGPYLVRSSSSSSSYHPTVLDLYDVYRLYSDNYRTFILGMYPLNDGSGRFASVRQYDSRGYLQIPVPSRLREYKDGSVMGGARIGVKDNFHIAGLPTAAGNRAYGEMYGDRNETASTVRKVTDLGGVLVGKTKTSQFTTGASTSDETIDEQYPWSPRADGYQSCGASSSGSACAVAAYDWLDFALGSDTGGSMRVPGALTGVYANRPSFGSMSLDGIMPLSEPYDSVGFFARSPKLFAEYNDSSTQLERFPELPHKIIVDPSWIIQETNEAQALIGGFLTALSSQLDMPVFNIDLDSLLSAKGWDASFVETVMLDGMFKTITYHTWKSFGHEFLTRYRVENEGRWPMYDTQNNRWWTWAEEKGYQKEIEEFESRETEDAVVSQLASWVNDQLLGSNEKTCSDSIFIYDIGTGGLPSYRSKALNVPGQGIPTYSNHRNNTLTSSYLCPLAQCVDYTIPIGQVPYLSAVSKRIEMMPVTVSLVARKGCDFMLADFVEQLAEKKLIAEVKSGREAF
ncbi:amidase signature domain-containing protein [Naematelia encephala]|uniref:Amidase signature domain-containing protein n=1 Tax=Naematelia encephala TaxID=71784 RepID=A0A1Y2BMC1_9TREE|nr:amidase signature domain-containing protein [Naematelia encephala]